MLMVAVRVMVAVTGTVAALVRVSVIFAVTTNVVVPVICCGNWHLNGDGISRPF